MNFIKFPKNKLELAYNKRFAVDMGLFILLGVMQILRLFYLFIDGRFKGLGIEYWFFELFALIVYGFILVTNKHSRRILKSTRNSISREEFPSSLLHKISVRRRKSILYFLLINLYLILEIFEKDKVFLQFLSEKLASSPLTFNWFIETFTALFSFILLLVMATSSELLHIYKFDKTQQKSIKKDKE